MSRFFIDRPVFAWALAIAVMTIGLVSLLQMPIEQYPRVAPPSVTIEATYPGASAQTVEDSVVQVIEQQLTGLDYLRYIESESDSTGNASITLTFNSEADPDIAQVQVQNKVQSATSMLPQAVQNQGLTVKKASGNFLIIIGFYSDDASLSAEEIDDYVMSHLKDPLSRIQGVGNITTFGAQYSIRVWFDPYKLVQYNLTTSEIIDAIKSQNAQISVGLLGARPAMEGQPLDITLATRGRLHTADEFKDIVVRADADGSQVRLGDVARIELGSESYSTIARFNGKPASGLAIMPAEGANALETVAAIKAKVAELSEFFPKSLKVSYPMDSTTFVQHSIKEVIKTLFEAMILVFFVMYLFLGSIRATLVPTLAIPVVLLGTFAVLAAAGFTLNTMTLFGMVLAIGLLVDDAIVVVENVERVMEEEGLSPREATRKSMNQISGALVGIGLVICAVFIPMAFFGGSSGIIYRQFAMTIAISVALSVAVALTFSPALCASLLKPAQQGGLQARRGFFSWFNRMFNRGADKYAGVMQKVLSRGARVTAICGLFVIPVIAHMYNNLPTSFLPLEDKGFLLAMSQLPAGATSEQSLRVANKITEGFLTEMPDSVEDVFATVGFGFGGSGQNQLACFIKLKDWEQRKNPGQSASGIQGRAMAIFSRIREASTFVMVPPPIQELANSSGFELYLIDNGNLGHDGLVAAQQQLIALAAKHPSLRSVRSGTLDDKTDLRLDIDYEKAGVLGVSAETINNELSHIFGSTYLDDFIDRGRVKKVYAQGDAPFRMQPEDITNWYVRNEDGDMVSFSSFITAQWQAGSPKLTRFNGVSSMSVAGEAAPGYSTGQAMDAMEELIRQLPAGIGYSWIDSSYEERLAGSNTMALYGLALLFVFLCLASLYENWAIPVSVLLIMPFGAFGVLAACGLFDLPNDVYFQVALITIIGLTAKNAILIVEFAKEEYDQGKNLIAATVHALRQRVRPVLMTSLAFGLGVLPLAVSSGPGSETQNAVGIGVVGGVLATTILGLFFIPAYFVSILQLFRVKPRQLPGEASDSASVSESSSSHGKETAHV